MKPHLTDAPLVDELLLNRWHIWAAKDRFLLIVAITIVLAFAVGFGVSRLVQNRGSTYEVTASIGAPPEVEPLLFKKVDEKTARQTNAAVPLTSLPVPSAAPFVFRGNLADFERATDCLAATIFYEAGAETVSGQMAVAQVVLNRVRHPAYPKSVCSVVFQGHERSTGCQFSYTCDGSMSRKPSTAAWAGYRTLAQAMLKGMVYRPVGLATHYHTDWVLPYWSARLDKVRVEGSHLFFRYHGYWGSPAAYRGAVSSVEASYGKMAALSSAHSGKPLDESQLVDAGDASTFPDAPDLERVSTELATPDPSKEVFLIYVDPLLDASALTRMAESTCQERKKCKVFAWADQALMPRGLPLDRGDRASMAFSFIRNGATSAGTQKWNCELFPRENRNDCL